MTNKTKVPAQTVCERVAKELGSHESLGLWYRPPHWGNAGVRKSHLHSWELKELMLGPIGRELIVANVIKHGWGIATEYDTTDKEWHCFLKYDSRTIHHTKHGNEYIAIITAFAQLVGAISKTEKVEW